MPPSARKTLVLALSLMVQVAVPASAADVQQNVLTQANTLLLEPESIQALGGWTKDGSSLMAGNTGGSAFAGFTISTPGKYRVWARSIDYPKNAPGSRRFRLYVDEKPAMNECGAHGFDGWRWELVAALEMVKGVHSLQIEDTARFFGRLESVLVTSTEFDPNTVERDELKKYTQKFVQATLAPGADQGVRITKIDEGSAGVAATLRNVDMELRLRKVQTQKRGVVLIREIEFLSGENKGKIWRAGVEPLHLLLSENPKVRFTAYSPTWASSGERQNLMLAGKAYSLPADERDAFRAGQHSARLLAVAARVLADGNVELNYSDENGGAARATARWSLPASGFAVHAETVTQAGSAGYYSLGFAAGGQGGVSSSEVVATQLPPLFQFNRMPDVPQMLTSSVTPHPMALVEVAGKGDSPAVTLGVVADADGLSPEWSKRDNARYGFSLRGPEYGIQPVVFHPILGGVGSHVEAGANLKAAWWVVTAPKSWSDTMREVDATALGLTDYREPWNCSLTWQALNIIDLIKSDRGFRWYDRLKGPMNIESADTATQSAPLMMMSAALLSDDRDFYAKRSLPSLEFMLSRGTAHFALSTEGNYYVKKEEDTRLRFENRYYGAALWQGFDDLTRGLNPWLRDDMTTNGKPRKTQSEAVPSWSEKLALYRSAPDAALLAEIQGEAETWAKREFNPKSSSSPGLNPFYNVSFYPYWWDLLDLYELTGSPVILDYARRGASLTVAGQWVHPVVRPGEMTLYPGGKITETRHVWWDGGKGGRLGFPTDAPDKAITATFDIPERKVPAWLPSTVGLSLEQPVTYFNTPGNSGFSNIQLTVWAPNLLRLSGITGDDYWRMYARNALIGRASTYPGYYMSGFMDLQHDVDYPVNGPDLTAFYWHHAPVHLAMVVDYLMTDAEMRTGGAVQFPYAKSQGYVWFSSRVYGGGPGQVFDDKECRLMLVRDKFGVDTPKVDYFGARGKSRFHLVLMNQARGETSLKASIDPAALGITPGSSARLRVGATSGEETVLAPGADGTYALTLERNGWAVLTFDASSAEVAPELRPLETRPVVVQSGDEAWGEVHAFRIRSPFGGDSLYAGLTGAPTDGVITFVPEGESSSVPAVRGAPYEISVGSIPMERDLRFRLRLERAGAPAVETPMIVLPGTSVR